MMNSKEHKYCAFISYRHVEADQRFAEWLVQALETYVVPKVLQMQGFPERLGRVFRDRDELPSDGSLNNQIEAALVESQFLVVICSPSTPSSRWVSREIEIFKELGRMSRILPVLLSGDPSESFPTVLTTTTLVGFDEANSQELVQDFEPIGADFRSASKLGKRLVRQTEILRIIAAILGCGYDDLRQRDWERQRNRRSRNIAIGASLAFVALSFYASLLFLSARELNGERASFLAEIARLQSDSAESETDQDIGQYDRAIRLGMIGTKSGILWPHNQYSFDQLVRAVNASSRSSEYNLFGQDFIASIMKPDSTELVMADSGGKIVIFDLSTDTLKNSFESPLGVIRHIFDYHPSLDQVAVLGRSGNVHVVDIGLTKSKFEVPVKNPEAFGAKFSPDGSLLLVWGKRWFHVWRTEDSTLVDEHYFEDMFLQSAQWLFESDRLLIHLYSTDYKKSVSVRDVGLHSKASFIKHLEADVQDLAIDANSQRVFLLIKIDGKYAIEVVEYPAWLSKGVIETDVEKFEHIKLSHNGKYIAGLASSNQDGRDVLYVYNAKRSFQLATIKSSSPIRTWEFGPDEDQVVTTHANGTIRLWKITDSSSNREQLKLQGHDGQPIANIFPAKDKLKVISQGSDGRVISWDVSSQGNRTTEVTLQGLPESMKFSALGDRLLALSDSELFVANIRYGAGPNRIKAASAKRILKLRRNSSEVVYYGWADQDESVILLFRSGEVVKVNATTGAVEENRRIFSTVRVAASNESDIIGIVADDGIYVASRNFEMFDKISDVQDETSLRLLFSNDGRWLLVGSSKGSVELWNLSTKSRLYKYQDSQGRPYISAAFSADTDMVVFSTRTDGARLLNTKTLALDELSELNSEYISVLSLLFRPGKPEIFAAGPTRFNEFGGVTVGVFDLDKRLYNFRFSYGGLESLSEFYGPDRLLLEFNSLSNRSISVISPDSVIEVARILVGRFRGGVAIDPNQKIVAIGDLGTIKIIDIQYALESDVHSLRTSVCENFDQMEVTNKDVQIVPVIRSFLGRNVCD